MVTLFTLTDSGVLSDVDMNKNTLSSNNSEQKGKMGSWNSLAYSFTDSAQSSTRDYSTGGSSRSAGTSSSGRYSSSIPEFRSIDNILPELSQVPFTSEDILNALQSCTIKDYCGNLSIECLERLTYLLQRPLIRIAREAKRLSQNFNKCSRHDIQSACKIILSPYMYKECSKDANQAVALYCMSTRDCKKSKSSQAKLSLSIGKHHRWLIEAHTAGYVHELAAVYLTAMMEAIAQRSAMLAISKDDLGKRMMLIRYLDIHMFREMVFVRLDVR